MLARGIGLGRAEALGEPDEHHADAAGRESAEVAAGGRSGVPKRRQAALDRADDRDAVFVQVKELDGGDAEQHRDERSGHDRREAPQREDHRERQHADEQRDALVSPRWTIDVPELLEEVAAALLDAEQLGHLADDDRQRQADDEALDHRLGDEARDEPQAQQPGEQRGQAGGDRERGGHRGEAIAADAATSAATVAADSAAVADIGPTISWRELPNAA